MAHLLKNVLTRGLLGILAAFMLASCDLSTPMEATDNAVVPSNF